MFGIRTVLLVSLLLPVTLVTGKAFHTCEKGLCLFLTYGDQLGFHAAFENVFNQALVDPSRNPQFVKPDVSFGGPPLAASPPAASGRRLLYKRTRSEVQKHVKSLVPFLPQTGDLLFRKLLERVTERVVEFIPSEDTQTELGRLTADMDTGGYTVECGGLKLSGTHHNDYAMWDEPSSCQVVSRSAHNEPVTVMASLTYEKPVPLKKGANLVSGTTKNRAAELLTPNATATCPLLDQPHVQQAMAMADLFIFLVRNPVDAYDALFHRNNALFMKTRDPTDLQWKVTFQEYLVSTWIPYVSCGLGRHRVVVRYEDMMEAPAAFMKEFLAMSGIADILELTAQQIDTRVQYVLSKAAGTYARKAMGVGFGVVMRLNEEDQQNVLNTLNVYSDLLRSLGYIYWLERDGMPDNLKTEAGQLRMARDKRIEQLQNTTDVQLIDKPFAIATPEDVIDNFFEIVIFGTVLLAAMFVCSCAISMYRITKSKPKNEEPPPRHARDEVNKQWLKEQTVHTVSRVQEEAQAIVANNTKGRLVVQLEKVAGAMSGALRHMGSSLGVMGSTLGRGVVSGVSGMMNKEEEVMDAEEMAEFEAKMRNKLEAMHRPGNAHVRSLESAMVYGNPYGRHAEAKQKPSAESEDKLSSADEQRIQALKDKIAEKKESKMLKKYVQDAHASIEKTTSKRPASAMIKKH